MSWIQDLYDTYNYCAGNESIPDADELCPVGYSIQNAHVEIVIDGNGSFKRAFIVPKEEAKTLIPVTERSLTGRTSGVAPHALCDSIQYCAGDYKKYGGKRPSYFGSYIEQLEKWVTSPSTHPKVNAIYTYVKKGTVVKNLIDSSILPIKEGTLLVEIKGSSDRSSFPIMKLLSFDDKGEKDLAKVFIRWSVESPLNIYCATWKDSSLFESWRKYLETQEHNKGFCCVTGNETILAQKHPAKLRNGKDNAKLISSNDVWGFTFLGRFMTAAEAIGVSSEVTQKAHSALRWLIGRKQAFRNGSQVFVSWATSGVDIPDPYSNTFDFLGLHGENSGKQMVLSRDIGQSFALRLNKKIAGYTTNINDSTNIVTLGLDSITPGRMSILFYRELTGSEFLARIEHWHSAFSWNQNFGKDRNFIGAPSLKDIAWAAYCSKVGKKPAEIDEKLLKATIERLLPCIIDATQLPKDIISSCVIRVSNRGGLDHWEWEKCLGIACAIYRGSNYRRRYKMALEEERNSRDYLYGRLLAVGEQIESMALYYAKENRDTTAARFMQRFSERPYSTWRLIENALVPYKARINAKAPGLLIGYQQLLDDIHCLFSSEDYISDKPLSGEYLLGYHCQRSWLYNHKREKGLWIEKAERDQDESEF